MKILRVTMLSAAVCLAMSSSAMANDDTKFLESLQNQINELKKKASEGENNFHMAGYFKLDYQNVDGGYYDGRDDFNKASFMPIFMYQMNDKVSFEGELEISTGYEGETDVIMEYAQANIELTDNLTLIGGKFFIPVGQFVQNLHPSWINKAVSAPLGFGHGGAAPTSDVGLQLRGGSYFGKMPINYAIYVGNGSTTSEGHGGLEVENEGMTNDWDSTKNFGGRIGILPMPNFEVGLSLMTGKSALMQEIEDHGEVTTVMGQKLDLDVFGADFVYRNGGLVLRGEYVNQELSDFSITAEDHDTGLDVVTPYFDNKWTSWYTQAAYRFNQSNWEAVVRVGDFKSQIPGRDTSHWLVGMNYYFTPSVIAKINFESQDAEDNTRDSDMILAQLTYGF